MVITSKCSLDEHSSLKALSRAVLTPVYMPFLNIGGSQRRTLASSTSAQVLALLIPTGTPATLNYIFGNKVFAPTKWSFEHTGRVETVQAQLISVQRHIGGYACIYFRENSKAFDPSLFLGEHLIANQNRETWAQAALLYHLQKLLENERESLCSLSINAAWDTLRSIPKSDIENVTCRLTS